MSRFAKKLRKIARERELEAVETGALVIALSNLELADALQDQADRLGALESGLGDINKTLESLLQSYRELGGTRPLDR